MTLAGIEARLAEHALTVLGGFAALPDEAPPDDGLPDEAAPDDGLPDEAPLDQALPHQALPGDGLPAGTQTLLLIGPRQPGFWPHLTAQPEWLSGVPDPVDRWSRRVIGTIACDLGAKALFPFGGKPFHPFYRWALRTGRIHASPVRLLVHDAAGLMVSFRGALALKQAVDLPPAPPAPCDACAAKPCLAACPPGALTARGYDLPPCHAYLDTVAGQACMTRGCAVRRACPLSIAHARMPEQSAYHMGQFHR